MSWGEELKKRREELGFTLQMAEEETKIRKLYLQALENDDFAVLPPRIYAIGFVKNYARFLGLNEEQLAHQFKELAYDNEGLGEDEGGTTPYRNVPSLPSLPPWVNIKNIAAAVVFLFIAIWVGNYLVSYLTGRNIVEQPPVNPPSVTKPQEQPPAPDENEVPEEQENLDETQNVDLFISARQDCWLEVSIDGMSDYIGLMKAGEEITFVGQESVFIKAGNAGGIEIVVNGEKQGIFGDIGQVKRQEFTL